MEAPDLTDPHALLVAVLSLHAEGHNDAADALMAEAMGKVAKSLDGMNSLSGSAGGFLVPQQAGKRKRRKKKLTRALSTMLKSLDSLHGPVRKSGFDESKIHRDHGQFSSVGGSPGKTAEPGISSETANAAGAPTNTPGGGVAAEHHATAAAWTAKSSIPAPLAEKYTSDMAHALAGMPDAVRKMALDNLTLRKATPVFYPDKSSLNAAASAITGKKASGVEGFVHTKNGSVVGLHLDGGNETDPKAVYSARGTYTHELWHVVDDGYYSEKPAWKAAWKAELHGCKANNLLSAYSRVNAEEGFAEFGRYLAEHGAEATRKKYPKCFKFLESEKLT